MALNVHSVTSFFFSKMAKKGQKWPKMAKNGQKWFACCKTRNLNLFLNSTFKSLNLPRPISKVEKF